MAQKALAAATHCTHAWSHPSARIQMTGIFNCELFVPKSFDGIQFRGFHRGPHTED
jgi:hypothetical protein